MLHYRQMTLGARNDEARTVEASLSSEQPVFRAQYGLDEVLVHQPDAVDLTRAPLPLLTSHDRNSTPVGIIENIRIEHGKLRGLLKFGGSSRAKDVWEDVAAGVLRSISIGYEIIKGGAEGDVYRVTRWRPYEASLVSVPADPTVGIGRSIEGVHHMEEQQNESSVHMSRSQRRGANRSEAESRQAMIEIQAMAGQFSIPPHQVQDFIRESGFDLDGFRRFVLSQQRDSGGLRPAESYDALGMSNRELQQYSFVRAIKAQIDPKYAAREAGLEMEASRAMGKQLGREAQGLFVPAEVLQSRAMVAGTLGEGGYLRPTEHLGSSFIDVLRNASHVMSLNVTKLNSLQGDVQIPKKTGASSAYWVDEGNPPTQTSMGFSQVQLKPKTVAGWTEYTRKLMLQASPDIETLVRADLASTIAVEVDRACISGSGLGAEPQGILNTVGVALVSIGDNGGAPTWEYVLDLEQALALSNADQGALAYLTTTKVRRKLKSTLKVSGDAGAGFVWQDGAQPGIGSMNGYRALASNNVPNNLTKGTGTNLSAMILGNWSDLFVGQWGGLDLLVDPYSLGTTGGFRVTAFLDLDVALRRTESFAVITDIVTT